MSVRGSDHPYYGTEGCYYYRSADGPLPHTEHASWADFLAEMGRADLDLNLLYRWDWEIPDPDDYEPGEAPTQEYLALFYMQQRKAKPWSYRVAVSPDDEPAVEEWLAVRARHMVSLWSPLLGETPS